MPPGPQRVKRSKAGCLACRQTRTPSQPPSGLELRQLSAEKGPMDPSWEQDLGLDVGQGVHVGMQEEMGLQETMQEGQEPDLGHRLDPPDLQPSPAAAPLDTFTLVQSHPAASANIPPQDLTQLVKLYFATAHRTGARSAHHVDGGTRSEVGIEVDPADGRFGGPATSEQLQKADQWVAETGDRLIAQVFNEFGAVELMVSEGCPTWLTFQEVVLCHTYDFLTGRYSRGMVMAGMAAR
ncbi:hypothetical protein IAU60_005428 [Kwoniella sp. DSM 27419]